MTMQIKVNDASYPYRNVIALSDETDMEQWLKAAIEANTECDTNGNIISYPNIELKLKKISKECIQGALIAIGYFKLLPYYFEISNNKVSFMVQFYDIKAIKYVIKVLYRLENQNKENFIYLG